MSGRAEIRDAATVIVLRREADRTRVLMGQRGGTAAFMPGKFVFPGGAVDDADHDVPIDEPADAQALSDDGTCAPRALAAAAIRETWEETGQILGRPGTWPGEPPKDWRGFAATGHIPDAASLTFFFRAVTPAGRPRRFDARFFLADAAALAGDPDDFAGAEPELSHLQWIDLRAARDFDLPFITQVVLAELIGYLRDGGGPVRSIPFFRNDDERHLVTRLGGTSPLAP